MVQASREMLWEAWFQVWLFLQLLWAAAVEAPEPGAEVPVVWAQEGAPAQLPCSPTIPLQDLSLPRTRQVTWQHVPESGSAAPTPRGPGPRRYTVLRLAPGGLRIGKLPLQPRVQLEEMGLQRGDFSLCCARPDAPTPASTTPPCASGTAPLPAASVCAWARRR